GGKSAVRKFLQKSIQIAESDLDDQNYCRSRFYPKVLKALASAPNRRRVEADQKSHPGARPHLISLIDAFERGHCHAVLIPPKIEMK
ncbi:MAG: hypothetical protein ABW346_05615, partial [Terrimicrobium sp.]